MNQYTHIVLDEVHERDVNIDFLLIVIRKMLSQNSPNTKIILMSATMNTEHFSDYFTVTLEDESVFQPPIIDLNEFERAYDIKESYLDDYQNIWFGGSVHELVDYDEPDIKDELYDYAVQIVLISIRHQLHKKNLAPAVLVFLPGLAQIETFNEKLCSEAVRKQFATFGADPLVVVLHSMMSTEAQRYAFMPTTQPKIILATNIAESGVTIPKVSIVVDFCLTKNLRVDKGAQISTLMLEWASKNNCKQRAGRTGRLGPGTVIRMVSSDFYRNQMQDYPSPEIQRIGLESVVIKTKVLDMGSPLELLALALDPPDKSSIVDAVLYLKELGGLTRLNPDCSFDYSDGDLTFVGRLMGALPVDVRLAKLLVMGYLLGVLDEMIIIAAGLSMRSIFTHSLSHRIHTYVQRLDWANGSGSDCIAVLNAYTLWRKMRGSVFLARSKEERAWCERHQVDLKNLSEMVLLIAELKRRLAKFNINESDDNLTLSSTEKLFMIKVCLAAAFGPANFFVPGKWTEADEREAFKAINNMDVFRTVYFKSMDRETFGDIYENQVRDAFKRKDIVDSTNDLKVYFDYPVTEKVYVTFQRDLSLVETSDEKKVVGKIPPEVYKAVKMQKIVGKLPLSVMSREKTTEFALNKGLLTVQEGTGLLKRRKITVKNPQNSVEPTSVTLTMRGYVTHVENCNKFWFKPVEAKIENSQMWDNRYKIIISNMQKTIQDEITVKVPASSVKDQLKLGDYLLVNKDEELQRAKLIELKDKGEMIVHLIDRGVQTSVDIEKVFVLVNEEQKAELFEIPPRIFQCTLTEIEPSRVLSRDGKWTLEAVELLRSVVNRKATVEIYSVVDDVVSVTLLVKRENWNLKLVKEKFAEDCEESYLSKLDNELRNDRVIGMQKPLWPEEEFKDKIDRAQQILVADAPAAGECDKKIYIQGPYSPLETTLAGISRFQSAGVNVDSSSVNSVLLNDDILNFNKRFYVAAEVNYNMKSKQMLIRETNMMPTIQGLSVILALIFCPTAELRRDSEKTRFVSILTGLGFDEDRQQPYYGERDAMIPVDFELSVEDLDTINQIRFCMSQVLTTEPGVEAPNLVGFEKEIALKKIREKLVELVNKKRSVMDAHEPYDAFNWNVDQTEVINRVDPQVNPSMFNFIRVPVIGQMPNEMRLELQQHVMNLKKCASNTMALYKKTCRLCGFQWDTTPELKLHLLSKKHIKRCENLFDV